MIKNFIVIKLFIYNILQCIHFFLFVFSVIIIMFTFIIINIFIIITFIIIIFIIIIFIYLFTILCLAHNDSRGGGKVEAVCEIVIYRYRCYCVYIISSIYLSILYITYNIHTFIYHRIIVYCAYSYYSTLYIVFILHTLYTNILIRMYIPYHTYRHTFVLLYKIVSFPFPLTYIVYRYYYYYYYSYYYYYYYYCYSYILHSTAVSLPFTCMRQYTYVYMNIY